MISRLKAVLGSAVSWYRRRGKLSKSVLWLLFLFFFLYTTISVIGHFRYALPDDHGFSLEGRKALFRTGNTLELYEYVSNENCTKNSETHVVVGKKSCAKVTTIAVPPVFEADNSYFLSAIHPDGSVIFGAINSSTTVWTIFRYINGETSIIKSYPIFDLDTFAREYAEGKTALTPEVQAKVGLVPKQYFKILDNTTIGFLDVMVSAVDIEKPIEAVVRERRVNIETGEEKVVERERERLDLSSYEDFMAGRYATKEFMWFLFRASSSGFIYNDRKDYLRADIGEELLSITASIPERTFRVELVEIDFFYDCYQWRYFDPPCIGIYDSQILYDQITKNGDIQSKVLFTERGTASLHLTTRSTDGRYIGLRVPHGRQFYYLLDNTTLRSAVLREYTIADLLRIE